MLLLSPRYTVSLCHAASTLLRLLKPHLLSLREHLACIMQAFPHREVDMWGRVWMSHFRGLWESLNFDKEYLFGFETLVFATSGILSIHNQLVTLASYKIYFINLISCEVALQWLYRKKRYINNLELNMIPLKNTNFNCKKFPIHQNESKLSACERRCPKACIPLTSENIPEVSF